MRRWLVTPCIWLSGLCLALLLMTTPRTVAAQNEEDFAEAARQLEARFHGRVGFMALDLQGGRQLAWRAQERFAFCSTFKALLAAAILQRSVTETDMLMRRLHWQARDEQDWSPVTHGKGKDGMTVAEVCAAALADSDNTAANLLLQVLGGPQQLTAYARSLGDETFLLDSYEPALNTVPAGAIQNTTTAQAYARTLQVLLTGEALPATQRQQLLDWMLATRTGTQRITAALPQGWRLAHKTGSNGGFIHDAGLAMGPDGQQVLFVIFSQSPEDTPVAQKEAFVAATARMCLNFWGMLTGRP